MIITNDPHTLINRVFFSPNRLPPDSERDFLYLLRRDLQLLYGLEDAPRSMVDSQAPLLAANGMMIGFELLAKLYKGTQKHKVEYPDMEEFLRDVAGLGPPEADGLTQFRHAVTHGYHLATTKFIDGKPVEYVFSLADSIQETKVIIENKPRQLQVNFWPLKDLFIYSIQNYREKVAASPDLQGKLDCAVRFMGMCLVTA